jgi:hypothetical protein
MKMKLNIGKIPGIIVFLGLLFIAPLGTWIFYKKAIINKKNIYSKANNLMWFGLFVLFLFVIGCYSKIKKILYLFSSGMSLDMIDLIPNNILLYIVGIMMFVSYFIGYHKLKKYLVSERTIIKKINIDKEYSLKKMAKKLSINIYDLIEKIKELQTLGYLVPIELDIEKKKIVYKDSNFFNKQRKCSKCGTLISLKNDEYIECDFCGNGIIIEK